jgi:hypothetical protein
MMTDIPAIHETVTEEDLVCTRSYQARPGGSIISFLLLSKV